VEELLAVVAVRVLLIAVDETFLVDVAADVVVLGVGIVIVVVVVVVGGGV